MSEIIKSLPSNIKYIKSTYDCSFVHNEKRVLICTSTHQWIEFFAYYACILLQRGCHVDFVWSSYYDTDNVDQATHIGSMLNVFEPILHSLQHDRLRVMQLKDIPMANLNEEILEELSILSKEDTSRIKYEVRVDHQGKDQRLYNRRLHCNHEVMASLLYLHQQNTYDSALTFSGKSCEMGATFRLMKKLGVPICTVEDLPFGVESAVRKSWKFPAVVLSEETVKDDWDKRTTYRATEKTLNCNDIFKKRLNLVDNPWSSFQIAKDGQVSQIINQLNINNALPTIILLPSFTFETHYWVEHFVFKDSVEWFQETLELLANRTDCQVIIRSHPYPGHSDEIEDPLGLSTSNETPEAMLQHLFDELPKNFRLVSAVEKVNTYDLLDISDMAICYTSMTGMEMAVRGKASVVPSSAHYTGKGFTYSPKSKKAYFQFINELIEEPNKMKLSSEQIELAQCYIETIYFDSVTSLPWTVTAPHLYAQWSIERMISLEGILSAYMDNIDSIVQEQHQRSAKRKLKEVNIILVHLRDYKLQNKWNKAKLLLGDFSKIDMDYVFKYYPEVYHVILNVYEELVEIAIYDASKETLVQFKSIIQDILKKYSDNSNNWLSIRNCLDLIEKQYSII